MTKELIESLQEYNSIQKQIIDLEFAATHKYEQIKKDFGGLIESSSYDNLNKMFSILSVDSDLRSVVLLLIRKLIHQESKQKNGFVGNGEINHG